MVDQVEVAIVGAGIAGLCAARSLGASGRSVVVLEGRDRVGGRLLSRSYPEAADRVDLGATWFWPNEPQVQGLIAELGIAVHPQHIEGDAIYHQPDGAARIDGNPLDVPSGRFVDGADALTDAIAAELPDGVVKLEHGVTSVRVDRAGLIVTTSAVEFQADHVILAVPPALAVERIRFDPPLPDRMAGLAAITPVWMGATIKVVIAYPKAFWRDAGLSGSAISHLGPMRELHDISGPDGVPAAIFGFVPGLGPDLDAPDEAAVVAQMVEMFGPQAANPSAVFIHDWRAEEWTSPPGVERLNAYQTYGHDLYRTPSFDGRLHWASTETSTVAPGHIEGAIAAAERAVAAIELDLGPSRDVNRAPGDEQEKVVKQP